MSYIYVVQDSKTGEVLGGSSKKYSAEYLIKDLKLQPDQYDLLAFYGGEPNSKRILHDHRNPKIDKDGWIV